MRKILAAIIFAILPVCANAVAGPAPITIPTMAAFVAGNFSSYTTVQLLGFHASSDGGEGFFNKNGTSCSANVGTVVKDAAGNCFYRATGGAPYNPKWFGAYGDGAHTDTTAMQATWNAAATDGIKSVNLGVGNYLVGDLTFPKVTHTSAQYGQDYRICGVSNGSSILTYTGSGTLIGPANSDPAFEQQLTLCNFTVATQADAPGSTVALLVDSTSPKIYGMRIRKFHVGIAGNYSFGNIDNADIYDNFSSFNDTFVNIGHAAPAAGATGNHIHDNYVVGTYGVILNQGMSGTAQIISTRIDSNQFFNCTLGVQLDGFTNYLGPNNYDGCTVKFTVANGGTVSVQNKIVMPTPAGSPGTQTVNDPSTTIDDPSQTAAGIQTYSVNVSKAWGKYGISAGSLSKVDAANIATATRTGTGVIVFTFGTAMPLADYAVVVSSQSATGVPIGVQISSLSTAGFTMSFFNASAVAVDPTALNFSVYSGND